MLFSKDDLIFFFQSVNKIFERRSAIQRPSCRFETVAVGNDEVCEVSEKLPGNNEYVMRRYALNKTYF